jgi:hypothetical protein
VVASYEIDPSIAASSVANCGDADRRWFVILNSVLAIAEARCLLLSEGNALGSAESLFQVAYLREQELMTRLETVLQTHLAPHRASTVRAGAGMQAVADVVAIELDLQRSDVFPAANLDGNSDALSRLHVSKARRDDLQPAFFGSESRVGVSVVLFASVAAPAGREVHSSSRQSVRVTVRRKRETGFL